MAPRARRRILPGFGLSLGLSWLYLGLIVLLPLSGLFLKTFTLTWEHFWQAVASPRALAAYRLTFGAAAVAALANAVFGLLVAWVLVRYRFPGKSLVDALVDLPFALPTAVAGLTLTSLYSSPGWYGRYLEAAGIQVAFTSLGVVVALTFIGLPFVVRTVQPVLEDIDADVEEAAATLGRHAVADLHARHLPQHPAGAAERLHPGARSGHWRVRLRRLHLGQHAHAHGDRSAAHRHPPGAV